LPESILLTLVRTAAGFWLELAVAAGIALAVVEAQDAGLLWLAIVGLSAFVAGVLTWSPTRTLVTRVIHGQSVRRRWSPAIRAIAIQSLVGRVPPIMRVRSVPAGEVLDITVPVGSTVDDLDLASESLAVALRLRDVVVERDPDNAAHATVRFVRRDPLANQPPAWRHSMSASLSLWNPIPVGVDEAGEPVEITLPERNVLLGGEPGAGKSVALSMLVATAALDPSVHLHLFDGKLVELATWSRCADHNVGVSTANAIDVLRELQIEMDDRYLALLSSRARKVSREGGQPLHVLVVDELAHYLLAPDRKERQEFAELLRDLVARGRAAGLIVLAATQKPSHDVIPTALRDLFGFRWALRCNTPQASDTVLGAGWASLGYNATDIDSAHRGVGYLLHEGGRPVRLRSHHIDDAALADLAARAERCRHPYGARNVGR